MSFEDANSIPKNNALINVVMSLIYPKDNSLPIYNCPLSYMLSNDVIENVLLPFLSMHDLFMLYLTNTSWKILISTYIANNIDEYKREWILDHLTRFLPYLGQDKEAILAAVKKDGNLLRYASEILRNDREVVIAALRQNQNAFQYVSESMKSNQDILFIAQSPNFRFKRIFKLIDEQFGNSFFIASDKQGNIFVSDCLNHMFDKNRKWQKAFESFGCDNSQFKEPMGIAFNSKNHLIVAEFINNRLLIFDENMQAIKSFGSEGTKNGQLDRPRGIAVDREDNIIVAEYGNHRIQIFNTHGESKLTIGKGGSSNGEFMYPCDVAVCKSNGRIFVSDCWNNRIQVFSLNGQFLFKLGSYGIEDGQFCYPVGLAITNCNRCLLVCDTECHRIQIFSTIDGSFVKSYSSQISDKYQLAYPIGICILSSGEIIVNVKNNNRIHLFEQNSFN